jgi:hypothetical protein
MIWQTEPIRREQSKAQESCLLSELTRDGSELT